MTGTFLDGRSFTQLRGAAFISLSETAQILAGTVTSDTGGGGTTTWTPGGTIPCRVDTLSDTEQLMAGRISDRSMYLISLPPQQPVTVANQIAVTGRGTFEVTALRDHTGDGLRLVEATEAS